MDIKLFENPTNEYRGKPFWSWNGKLEKDELLRQIDVFESMGMGGFFMHSRTGLITEYLGDEWFELVNACSDYGYSKGMECYIYDEDRWPSGTAGGKVTQMPLFRAKFIEKSDSGYNIVEMKSSSFYNGYTYVDTMKREATDYFIGLTHEKYKIHCGKRLGREIKGVFTDEPHRGPLFSRFSMGSIKCIPYTDNLFDEFEKKYGYKLQEHLDELFDEKIILPVKHDYCELTQQLFIDNFMKPLYDWCNDNNMVLTGHMLHEDSLANQTAMQGSLMRSYEYMHIPGMDNLTEHNNKYWVAVQCRSVARQLGKKWVMSELYGATGWHINFQSHKHIGDWQALFGINARCHHLSWYTMGGEAKRDYPASIFHQSAWYREYKYVEDYFSRLHIVLSTGMPQCELLYISPVESLWSKVYSGVFDGLETTDEELTIIERIYVDNFFRLAENGIDFDYGDQDILNRHGEPENGVLRVGKMTYNKVLISGMIDIRSSTYELLKEYVENGGKLIVAGKAPEYMDSLPYVFDIDAEYISLDEIPEYCCSGNEVKTKNKDIFVQTRLDDDCKYCVLLNMSRENEYDVILNLGKGVYAYELSARDGKIRSVDYSVENGDVIINTHFAKGQEKIYCVKSHIAEICSDEYISDNISLPEEAEYSLSEPNILVLDMVEYNGEIYEILKADRKIRDEFKLEYRSGGMIQPWCSAENNEYVGDIELIYPFEISTMPDKNLEFVLEHYDDFEVFINGKKLDMTESAGKWIDICFDKFILPLHMLNKGKNYITLKTKFHKNNDLEAIYILGDFAVNDRYTIDILPNKLKRGDITKQGLPFYSGTVTYHFDVNIKAKSRIKVDFNGALAKVNGRIVAFEPYTVEVEPTDKLNVEIIFTRRNTFGPLHQLPKLCPFYNPDSYVTEGAHYTDDYVLFEQGLI